MFVSQWGYAGEAPATLEPQPAARPPVLPPAPAEEPPPAEPPATEAPQAEPHAAPQLPPRGPRVIWAASGEAPPRPPATVRAEEAAPRRQRFRLRDVRWVIGLDRASSLAGYRATNSSDQLVTSGVEASIVGNVNQEAFTPLVLPRLSIDRRWANGFSLGVALSYAARSDKRASDVDAARITASESALLGARLGWMKPLMRGTAFWLRGGPTWAMRASSVPASEPSEQWKMSQRHIALSLEPELVLMPLRHIGVSLGASFDLGLGGANVVTVSGGPDPYRSRQSETVSTAGITVGLLALF
jgi:hypothetical protein